MHNNYEGILLKSMSKSYQDLYKESLKDPESFWGREAEEEIIWFKKWKKVLLKDGLDARWFDGGKLNITYNCLDRHIKDGKGKKIAYIWTNEKGEEAKITYEDLLSKVNKTANYFSSLGLKKGDTLTIYMPLVIEQIVATLACARIGVIHSVVFAGFSHQALNMRIKSSGSKYLVTADCTFRKGREIDLLPTARKAIKNIEGFQKIIVLKRKGKTVLKSNEADFREETAKYSEKCEPLPMNSEDKLFVLYTSGTTGEPKGIIHTIGGYTLYSRVTMKYSFDIKEDDIYWCTADSGWITGHSYVIYGPLLNAATTVIFEGAPDYPDPGVWWRVVEKYKVTIFYTSPTAIRMLKSFGNEFPRSYNLTSLRILGSVGEPLNVSAWNWLYEFVGGKKCFVVDTWWQTETGGHILTTVPGQDQKPGFVGLPYFGLEALIVNNSGDVLPDGTKGFLVIKGDWPASLRGCWNDRKRFEKYWTEIPGYFFTGDIAVKDEDGYIRILGRSDDIIVVSGHNIGSGELETIINTHPKVAESAVVGIPDEIKGNKIVAYVILNKGENPNEGLSYEISGHVGVNYGKHARPEKIVFVDKLPKTRSGKIMRRVLRAKENGGDCGDTSTLED